MEQERKLKPVSTEEKKGLKRTTLNPDEIMNTLFRLDSIAEYYHLQTTSFAQHKMLDELHSGVEDSKDAICEYLLGIQAPRKFGVLSPDIKTTFSPANLDTFLQEGYDFSVALCTYAEENNWEQLCNLASELQGIFVKGKYLNTLK